VIRKFVSSLVRSLQSSSFPEKFESNFSEIRHRRSASLPNFTVSFERSRSKFRAETTLLKIFK